MYNGNSIYYLTQIWSKTKMGRMSDADIEVRSILDWEMEENGIETEYEKQNYIQQNYERVGREVLRRLATAARMVQ